MSDIERTRQLVERIVRALVDDGEAVRVGIKDHTFKIHVGLSDLDKVIGQQGRVARNLRSLVSDMGKKLGTRFFLDIIEEPILQRRMIPEWYGNVPHAEL